MIRLTGKIIHMAVAVAVAVESTQDKDSEKQIRLGDILDVDK